MIDDLIREGKREGKTEFTWSVKQMEELKSFAKANGLSFNSNKFMGVTHKLI